jgi:hypothetical protein
LNVGVIKENAPEEALAALKFVHLLPTMVENLGHPLDPPLQNISNCLREHAKWKTRRAADKLLPEYFKGGHVLLHHRVTISGTITKLIGPYCGSYLIIGPHINTERTISPNVFDLRHIRTGDTKSGIAALRLRKHRPGGEFSSMDFKDSTQTTTEHPTAPSKKSDNILTVIAPLPSSLDDLNFGDNVIYTTGRARKDWQVGKLLAIDEDKQTIHVHSWNGYSDNIKTRAYNQALLDPKDDKKLHTMTPARTHREVTAIVHLNKIVHSTSSLLKGGPLPQSVLQQLVKEKRVVATITDANSPGLTKAASTNGFKINVSKSWIDIHQRPSSLIMCQTLALHMQQKVELNITTYGC